MKVVVQRVEKGAVTVDGVEKASIGKGFLLLVGVAREDSAGDAGAMAGKIAKMRVFEDENGKMNLGIKEVGGEVLSVPQFTLLARTEKGNRPGFDDAADPATARDLWKAFNEGLRGEGVTVKEGEFGAHMKVSLVNDGPVTFVIETDNGGVK
jgi:D-tyrosyl-tRNA(Tyr) deacylase